MPSDAQPPRWGPLSLRSAGQGFATHVEVNGVPLDIAILPPVAGPLADHLAATWQTFQTILPRMELAVALAAEALIDAKLPDWIAHDDEMEDLDVAALRNCLALDSLVFGADRSFTLWFRSEHPFPGECVRIEGNQHGQFLEAGT